MPPANPRRVPWTTPIEFQNVFTSLFASDGDITAQRYGIERINVWLSRGNCPHAAESTANLLALVLRDSEPAVGTSSRPSQQELRLSYSMALIRFVNSLVDPLQTTYFARSMASLAAQLGLPLWFVELRHAATHEDLPGLQVLREAARQALDYLYTTYWLPSLTPSSTAPLHPLTALRPLLATYKALAKTSLRDASKANKLRVDLQKTYRGIEGWVLEAESLGRGRERAVEGLVEGLVELGGVVPMAKKKRASAREPQLSTELAAIWTPLLSRLEDTYDGFLDVLITRMVDLLSLSTDPDPSAGPQGVIDRSYPLTLSAWVIHLLQASEDPQTTEAVVRSCLLSGTPNALALLDNLSKADDILAATVKPLIGVLRNSDAGLTPTITNEDEAVDKLAEMERRMAELDQLLLAAPPPPTRKSSTAPLSTTTATSNGWPLATNWKPCPIGSLPGGKIPTLDLPPLRVA